MADTPGTTERDPLPDRLTVSPDERQDPWADSERETIARGRYEVPREGDLLSFSYKGGDGRFESTEGIVLDVQVDADDETATIETTAFETEGIHLALDLNAGEGEVVGFTHGYADDAWVLCATEVVVPVSQVENPGIEEGDHVKVRTGDQSHHVEKVEDGRVYLSDINETWSVPVTHITAFDEDVDDYDPFETFWDREKEEPPINGPERPSGPGE